MHLNKWSVPEAEPIEEIVAHLKCEMDQNRLTRVPGIEMLTELAAVSPTDRRTEEGRKKKSRLPLKREDEKRRPKPPIQRPPKKHDFYIDESNEEATARMFVLRRTRRLPAHVQFRRRPAHEGRGYVRVRSARGGRWRTTSTTPKFYSAGGTGRGPEAPTHAGKIMESFVMRLEAHLNCQREELNLYDLWASTGSVQPPRVVWPVAAGSDANMRAISNLFNGLSVNGGPFPLFDANAALAEEAIGG
ncbi:hypothetical protein PG996_010639 [Apiospora saccharicola]|uniref:Uncharacterized protein n=1 Tax=Apiospora saccharicola TaxID=335842 RepID=A0ABR1US89_9PEZI